MGSNGVDAENEWPILTATLYGVLSFAVVLAAALLLLLIACRRRYALNWFEKNLLETAREDSHRYCNP
jgi:hypothetical protein